MTHSSHMPSNIVWWGRADCTYSRNGVIRTAMNKLNIQIQDFKPWSSKFGHIQSYFSSLGDIDAVWVPCFRQRDMASASKFAKKKNIPLFFDPLISAYDKQVFERDKFAEGSAAAKKLLGSEQQIFQLADVVIADTWLHAEFFEQTLGVPHDKIVVIPVSAEEDVFYTASAIDEYQSLEKFRVLFYGSYLALHGVDAIVSAILAEECHQIDWTLIGDGPMRAKAEEACKGLSNVHFIDSVEYHSLTHLIHASDLVLGIFGTSEKASRVIPNKVYQALACGRPVVTLKSAAYPEEVLESKMSGIYWVEPTQTARLLGAISRAEQGDFDRDCKAARQTYDNYFSNEAVKNALEQSLAKEGVIRC